MSQDTQPPAPSAPGAGASTPPPPEPPVQERRLRDLGLSLYAAPRAPEGE